MPALRTFPNRSAAAGASAALLTEALETELKENGTARFLTAGGTSPVETFNLLADTGLDWARVQIGLVDDRWVAPDHPASNEGLVRRHLLVGKAASASFLPLWREDSKTLIRSAQEAYGALSPISALLLGMGEDGHTASWFPGAKGLSGALGCDSPGTPGGPGGPDVLAIDASGSDAAGTVTRRITVTRRMVATAKRAVLLIFGETKKSVVRSAMTRPVADAPVRAAIDDLGARLVIIWAP